MIFSAFAWWIAGGEGNFVATESRESSWEDIRESWGAPNLYIEADTPVGPNPNNRIGDATRQPYVPPLQLGMPRNYSEQFKLDSARMGYSIYERVGKIDIRPPSYIDFKDYLKYRREEDVEEYFRQKSLATNREEQNGLELNIDMGELTDVFGGGPISVRPTGLASLSFSLDNNKTNNPNLPIRQQSTTIFNFDQQIQLGVIGQIGKKMKLNANFDTQASFDFENELKLEHSGTEDQILQKIEAGNVSMQLGNSLIQGRQNLFGIKTKLRFGPVYFTAIASTERGQINSVNVSGGGAIETPYEKEASDYDMNRHFFLSHYFRSRYEAALKDLPVIRSTARVNRVEIWVEQQGATSNTRNTVGFIDLGENSNPTPDGGQGVVYNPNLQSSATTTFSDNSANNLFSLLQNAPNSREQATAKGAIEGLGLNMINTEDFQVLGNMRRLNPNEYTVNTQLGYISLNSPLPTDQVLFVAFDYSVNGQNFQVGEFSDDVPANGLNSNVIFTKMLKSSVLRVNTGNRPFPAWDLMMKNIYSIGYGLKQDGFFLDVKYESGTSAGKINYLPSGAVANKPLIQVVGLDRLTNHTSLGPDNFFDYIEGITVLSDRGIIIFPVLEPFGSNLATKLQNDPNETTKYVFDALYNDTKAAAVQDFPQLDRFTLEGYYRSSSSSEIPLNTFNLAEGSVTVTAGGRQLTEGSDFQVDYFGGKVTIINPAILSSGQDIQVSYESSSLYQVQTKTLLGGRAEFAPSDNLQLGLTALNLREQPFNQKLTLGDEPVNNTLWGFDASYQNEAPLITKLVDKIPLISTKAPSNIQAAAEFAQFVPGVPGVIKNDRDRGIVYLDDFEAAATPYTLQGVQHWQLAS
ncbi:MAG: cell surface protein SprA, partial [Bacteroidia bacterium]|nr:cell surface protein SprA [Bacteroidia bacterium]